MVGGLDDRRDLLRWVADTEQLGREVSAVLREILATTISPELVPATDQSGARPAQSTEAVVGPYELQDFTLYYTLRFGHRPAKVAFLAYSAWPDRTAGTWPEIPPESRREYTLDEIKHWLWVFSRRFLRDQPVQGRLHSQRAEGGLGRLAIAARRLASAERRRRCRVALGAG